MSKDVLKNNPKLQLRRSCYDAYETEMLCDMI